MKGASAVSPMISLEEWFSIMIRKTCCSSGIACRSRSRSSSARVGADKIAADRHNALVVVFSIGDSLQSCRRTCEAFFQASWNEGSLDSKELVLRSGVGSVTERFLRSFSANARFTCACDPSEQRVVLRARPRRHHAARGKLRGEAAAYSRRAVDLEGRLVPRQGVLDDGESQARAAGFARAPAVHPVEAFREPGDVLGFDADPGVFHRELGAFLGTAPDEADLAPGRRVAHGVAREVAEGAGDLGLGPEQVEPRLGVGRESLAACPKRSGFVVDP